jgi:hypothetical protein
MNGTEPGGRPSSPPARRDGDWSIGIYAGPSPLLLSAAVTGPVLIAADVTDLAARFVADPFLVRSEGRWHLFFEVMPAGSRQGVIALAGSRDGRTWRYERVVLREPFHLSYPHVFAWQGEHYLTPETLAAGCVRLYRANPFPYQWEPVADLVAGQHADPTVFRAAGRWWMFTCTPPGKNATLRLYHAEALTGPWLEHPRSPVVRGDARFARPAGRVACWRGELFRFSQDCSERYGKQVYAFRLLNLTRAEYREELASAAPVLGPGRSGEWNSQGLHHVDAQPDQDGGWIAAVDGTRE